MRLSFTHAHFVQVIHTDGNCELPATPRGTMRPLGHVDFYANGGMNQPGSLIRDVDHSHAMAHEYYIKSFEFKSKMVTSYLLAKTPWPYDDTEKLVVKTLDSAVLGWYCDKSAIGNYHVGVNITDLVSSYYCRVYNSIFWYIEFYSYMFLIVNIKFFKHSFKNVLGACTWNCIGFNWEGYCKFIQLVNQLHNHE